MISGYQPTTKIEHEKVKDTLQWVPCVSVDPPRLFSPSNSPLDPQGEVYEASSSGDPRCESTGVFVKLKSRLSLDAPKNHPNFILNQHESYVSVQVLWWDQWLKRSFWWVLLPKNPHYYLHFSHPASVNYIWYGYLVRKENAMLYHFQQRNYVKS